MPQGPTGGRGHEVIALYLTWQIVTTIAFSLRVYVRVRLVKGTWEDWVAGLGWALFICYSSFGIAAAHHGLGQHIDLIPPEELPRALKLWWCCVPFYAVSNIAVKLSIAIMLLRFVVEDYQKKTIYVVTALIEAYGLAYLFGFMFQCTPLPYFWTKAEPNSTGHCINPKLIVVASYGYSIMTLIYDGTMALLPWFVVRKMQLDLRTRVMVACVLAFGSIASVATLVRLAYVPDIGNRTDFLYKVVDIVLWSCCETGLSITAASAATLKPLFRQKRMSTRIRTRTAKLETIPLSSGAFSSGNTTTLCESEVDESAIGTELDGERRHCHSPLP